MKKGTATDVTTFSSVVTTEARTSFGITTTGILDAPTASSYLIGLDWSLFGFNRYSFDPEETLSLSSQLNPSSFVTIDTSPANLEPSVTFTASLKSSIPVIATVCVAVFIFVITRLFLVATSSSPSQFVSSATMFASESARSSSVTGRYPPYFSML